MSGVLVLAASAAFAMLASASASAQGASAPPPLDRGTPPADAPPAISDEALLQLGLEAPGEVVEIKDDFQTEAQRLQRSAEAVNVIDTRKAQQQTVDLGEVLARSQGVHVRRGAGLGSSEQFSLNGLEGDQIRFFLDGVPLDVAGFPFGVANVPVNLIDRVEVYRGVVPIRFGADALGGAVNLVRVPADRTRLAASYQVGSFGTHRLTLDGAYRDARRGWTVGGAAFLDVTRNNYPVEVQAADELGELRLVTVERFHDGYRAGGGTVEAALLDRPWARRLSLAASASTFDKELQNNVIMAKPYGEVTYQETVLGATARYEVGLSDQVDLEVVGSYAHRSLRFTDTSPWVYDWYGKRVFQRMVGAGEITATPTDQRVWQNAGFGRATATWKVADAQVLRFSLSPSFTTRSGNERRQFDPTLRDPLSAQRDLFTLVGGAEHDSTWLDGRLAHVVFAKGYVYRASTEEVIAGGELRARDRALHTLGAGDSLRLRFLPWLSAKASYEYATRMPRPDEVFGDAVLVKANLDLAPEVSHNANLGPRLELTRTPIGDLMIDVSAFVRDSDKLIQLFGDDRNFSYQNVFHARGAGLEHAVAWSAPGRWLSVDGTLTYEDVRVVSDGGAFAAFNGDRIPNRPYLFGSWGARVRVDDLPGDGDVIEPFYHGRYVHAFYRSWESQGDREGKQQVASQLTHSLGVSWTASRGPVRMTSTIEVDNVLDAQVFDSFGAQRPGRAFYLKLTGEL